MISFHGSQFKERRGKEKKGKGQKVVKLRGGEGMRARAQCSEEEPISLWWG